MDITVLKNKPTTQYNNENFKDLSYNSYSTYKIFDYILGVEFIDENTEMRPDLISLKWYGSADHIDIILKCNNIFNPFSIQAEDMLIIPQLRSDEAILRKLGTVTTSQLINNYIDPAQMTAESKNKLSALIAKGKDRKNRLKNPLPPNMIQSGVTVKKYTGGKIDLTSNSK